MTKLVCERFRDGRLAEWSVRWRRGRWLVKLEWRSPWNFWGRFGGGWQWRVGVQAGGSTVVVHLLVVTALLSWYRSGTPAQAPAPVAQGDPSAPF